MAYTSVRVESEMKKKIIELEYNQLLSLFVSGNYKMPFSSQSNLTLYVPYPEYIEFIRWLCVSELSLSILQYDISKYKERLLSYDRGVENAFEAVFIYDLLTACIKELNMSQARGLQPTYILGVFSREDYTIMIKEIDTHLPDLISKKENGLEIFKKARSLVHRYMQSPPITSDEINDMNEISRDYYFYCLLLGFIYYSARGRSVINVREREGDRDG